MTTRIPPGFGLYDVPGQGDKPLVLSKEHASELKAKPHLPGKDGSKEPTVAEVLEQVGGDPEKAAAALEAETAGKNRSTLVSQLQAIAGGGEQPQA